MNVAGVDSVVSHIKHVGSRGNIYFASYDYVKKPYIKIGCFDACFQTPYNIRGAC